MMEKLSRLAAIGCVAAFSVGIVFILLCLLGLANLLSLVFTGGFIGY